jgi:hypothetical protein
MHDDFRIRAVLADSRQARELGERLERGEVPHELATGAQDRVIVSVDGPEVFLYADTLEQAQRARRAIEALARGQNWTVETEIKRWHPVAEEWDDPDAPLPAAPEDLAAEHAELVARERAESGALGFSAYEVRIQCATHRDTVTLAERLRDEGLPVVQRWRYLLVGATDEDSAAALADRITQEAPPGTTVTVEASLGEIAAETGFSPFAVFGGLGG